MSKLKAAWDWLKVHWYVPLTIVVAILGVVTGTQLQRRGSVGDARKRVKRELEAIDASTAAAKVVAEKGAERALEAIEEAHATELEVLDEKQKAKAERLRKDPAALSKFLVRVGKRG